MRPGTLRIFCTLKIGLCVTLLILRWSFSAISEIFYALCTEMWICFQFWSQKIDKLRDWEYFIRVGWALPHLEGRNDTMDNSSRVPVPVQGWNGMNRVLGASSLEGRSPPWGKVIGVVWHTPVMLLQPYIIKWGRNVCVADKRRRSRFPKTYPKVPKSYGLSCHV